MFRDFLVGTFAKILDIILVLAGVYFLIDGLVLGNTPKIIGGVLCLAASFGVMYALRQRTRYRR